MIVTLLLIAGLTAIGVPLIQRDLKRAHARIEARRRWAAMSPQYRELVRLSHRVTGVMRAFGAGMAAFGTAVSAALAEEQRRSRDRALREGLRGWGQGDPR